MEWFYGFKLFIIVNALGELVQAFVTPGHTSDSSATTIQRLFKGLNGLAFADNGFINQGAIVALITYTTLHRKPSIFYNPEFTLIYSPNAKKI